MRIRRRAARLKGQRCQWTYQNAWFALVHGHRYHDGSGDIVVFYANFNQVQVMKKVILSSAVKIAISSLDADGTRQVQAWFDRLQRWDEDEVVRKNSVLLDSLPGVYFMRTTTDIRIFFRIDGDTITVLDVAKKAAILAVGGISVTGDAPNVINPAPQVK
jgi:hypothetical protein